MSRDDPLARQLQNANSTIRELQARQTVYESAHGPVDERDVLVQVARTVREARSLAQPAVRSTPTDSDGPRTKPGSKAPTGVDRRIARRAQALERDLWRICDQWDRFLEDLDSPDDPRRPGTSGRHDTTPTVRCHRRSCPARGRRVPAFTETGDPIETCPHCHNTYSNHPADAT